MSRKIIFVFILLKQFIILNCSSFEDGTYLTQEDVSLLMTQPFTQQYLAGFNDSFQRLVITKQLEKCPFSPLCNFAFGLQLQPGARSCCEHCECSYPQCWLKQTCCLDVLFQNLDLEGDKRVTDNDLKSKTGLEQQKSCISLSLSKNEKFNRKGAGVLGFASCPRETSKQLAQNCSKSYILNDIIDTFEDITPVVSTISNEVYRNKYCAYCHNIENDNLQFFRKMFQCESIPQVGSNIKIIEQVTKTGECDVRFVSQITLHKCTVAVTGCNITGDWNSYNQEIENACALYTSVYEGEKSKYFKNVFCSECNGVRNSDLNCELKPNEEPGGFSFSGLLKMEGTEEQNTFSRAATWCSNDEIYDQLSGVCREIFCPINMDLVQGKCVNKFEYLENIMYSVIIRVIPFQTMTLDEAIVDAETVYDMISQLIWRVGYICKSQMILQTYLDIKEAHSDESVQRTENSSFAFYDIRVEVFVEPQHDPTELMDLLKSRNFSLYESDNTYEFESDITFEFESDKTNEFDSDKTYEFENDHTYEFTVIDGDAKLFQMIAWNSNENGISDNLYKGNKEHVEQYRNRMIRYYAISGFRNQLAFPYFYSIKYNEEICSNKQKAIDIVWLKACPKVKVSSSVFPWNETIKSIIVQPGDFNINREDFYYHDQNNLMVCVNDFMNFTSSTSSSDTLSFSHSTILSLVCSALSIVCLAITFIIFSAFAEMRQAMPGKNNMCLVLFMLIANSLYMTSGLNVVEKNSNECVILGVFVHFFWLISIFWMSICTFHMFRVLSRTKMMSKDLGMKRMICYHLFATFMSAAFVSINIAVSYFRSDGFGYGDRFCYISSQSMINFTIVVPTACVVFSNIFMFIFVIIKIERVSIVKKHVQNERRNMTVFAKLSTITGVTWIFGLLYSWTNVSVLSYLFIILNACQGVFIMLAFVVNRRVFNHMKSFSIGSSNTDAPRTSNTSLRTKY